MSDTKDELNLSALANDYDIVGELGTHGNARTFMATRRQGESKRRDDETRVLVTVLRPPAGDEGNALSHVAADTQLLSTLSHRRLIRVIEGRWLGKDAYAVITERTTDTSLADRIIAGEKFSSPRIAAILREVNGLLEWAREHQIVHRDVYPDGVYLEPKTDRVRVAFAADAIPRIGRESDIAVDGRTIAKLAMAFLTGNGDASADDARKLAEQRDDLPDQLGESTAALLADKSTATTDDVASYLALIGMADPLAAGESERERIRAEMEEEQRVEREKLSKERATFESMMTSERATFDHLIAGERAQFAHERETARNAFEAEMADLRAKFAKEMADERERAAKEKADERERLAQEKAELRRAAEVERADLVAKRAELERSVAEQKAEIERIAKNDRAQIEQLRASIKARGELEVERKRDAALENISDDASLLDDSELIAPGFVPPVIQPLGELTFNDDSALMSESLPEEEEQTAAPVLPAPEQTAEPVAEPVRNQRKWLIPGLTTAAAIIVLIVVGITLRRQAAAPAVQSNGSVAAATKPAVASTPVAVKPSSSDSILAAHIADSVRVDSLQRDSVRTDSVRASAERAAARRRRAAARADSARRDSLRRSVPDTQPRRDSIP